MRMLGFRWHVVFIVFGQHFRGGKLAVSLELALGHHAFAFTEQVRQDAGVGHGHFFDGVGDDKRHGQVVALDGAGFDHAANAKGAVFGRFARFDLAGGEEEHQIALESIQDEVGSDAEWQPGRQQSWRRVCDEVSWSCVKFNSLCESVSFKRFRKMSRRLARTCQISAITTTAEMPKLPQT